MDIVKNEICKLLTKRTVLILLFLLVLNPVLGLYTMNTVNDDGYTDKDYSALYGEISNYSREEVLPEIEQRQMTAETYCSIISFAILSFTDPALRIGNNGMEKSRSLYTIGLNLRNRTLGSES